MKAAEHNALLDKLAAAVAASTDRMPTQDRHIASMGVLLLAEALRDFKRIADALEHISSETGSR